MSRVISIILSIISLVLNLFQVQQNETFTVDFMNYDNTNIASYEVKLGESLEPPVAPRKSGATFLGWQGNYINVQKDETVKAIFNDEKNVFIVSSSSGNVGDIVSLLVSLDGVVETCGFDMIISYDDSLELISANCDLDLDIIANTEAGDNKILLNYSSVSNKKKSSDIINLRFRLKETKKSASGITVVIKSNKKVVGNTVVDAEYTVVNGVIWKR